MDYNLQPLRIRAYLQTQVISAKHLPLDGILYAQHVRNHIGELTYSLPNESVVKECNVPFLPLARANAKLEDWYYHCSFAQWHENTIEDSTFKTKQGDWVRSAEYLEDKVKKIDNSRGKYKGYHMKLYYQHAKYVDWYCVGDMKELSKLLNFCTAIGKNTGDGWGSVLKWEICEWFEDWSIRDGSGKLMRAIPNRNGIPYGIRPSYWNPKHIFKSIVPK